MTFEDLPPNWSDHPLTADLMPDVVDLFVSEEGRFRGCLIVLLLDSEGRVLQPIQIDDIPLGAGPTLAGSFLDQLNAMLAEQDGQVLVARGRRGHERPDAADEEWASVLSRTFGSRLVAFFLATPGSAVTRVEAPPRAA